MFVPIRERKVAVANEIVHRVAAELGLTGGAAARHHEARRARRTFFNSYGDLFHPNDRGYEIWASAFEPAVDARVDTVAAIRHYLSAREAEDLGARPAPSRAARASRTWSARRARPRRPPGSSGAAAPADDGRDPAAGAGSQPDRTPEHDEDDEQHAEHDARDGHAPRHAVSAERSSLEPWRAPSPSTAAPSAGGPASSGSAAAVSARRGARSRTRRGPPLRARAAPRRSRSPAPGRPTDHRGAWDRGAAVDVRHQ